jgi:hypothetical protein
VTDTSAAALAALAIAVLVLIFLPYIFFVLELLLVPLVFAYRVVLDRALDGRGVEQQRALPHAGSRLEASRRGRERDRGRDPPRGGAEPDGNRIPLR